MRINCVSCGHRFDVGDAYDDFEGPVRCCICGSLLHIKTEGGQVKSIRVAPAQATQPSKEGAR